MVNVTGNRDLSYLLKMMNPVLNDGEFVFSTVQDSTSLGDNAVLLFREEEGTSVIVRREIADDIGLQYERTWAWITLSVHSDLSAVGFLAEVTRSLASRGISCNVVSAFYHDHLFVPYSRKDDAVKTLKELSE